MLSFGRFNKLVIIQNECIESIPLLHVVKKSLHSAKLPLILFVHGFTSTKEQNLNYAYLMAEKGFRVLLPEALHHGERSKGLKEKDLYMHFWDIVLNTIHDLSILKTHYDINGLIDTNNIGVAGTSMGGIVTLGALTQFDWITAAVSLMGNPQYGKFALSQIDRIKQQGWNLPLSEEKLNSYLNTLKHYDLSLQPEKLNGRPLLFWHGKQDSVVPFSYAHQFYESLKPGYDDDKWSFIIDEKAGHKVSREGVTATVQWFEKHLQTKH